MNSNWAETQLATIRTLMERSSLYRIELAPIFLLTGILGTSAGIGGYFLGWNSPGKIAGLWIAVVLFSVGILFYFMRKECSKRNEPFFTIPAKRIVKSTTAISCTMLIVGSTLFLKQGQTPYLSWILLAFLVALYGCLLNCAGFFLERGIRWLGEIYVGEGMLLFLALNLLPTTPDYIYANLVLGTLLGVENLIYGCYLKITVKNNQ